MKNIDPRQHRSQDKLEQAYLTLLTQGFEQMTIQQICKEAGVTRPTFYKQYKDIQDLRLHLHQSLLAKLKQALTITNLKPMVETEEKVVYSNVRELFLYIQANPISFETLLVHKPDALFIKELKAIIKQFIQEGTEVSQIQHELIDANLDFIMSFYTGAYYETIVWWIHNSYSPSAEQMTMQLVDMSMKGPLKTTISYKK